MAAEDAKREITVEVNTFFGPSDIDRLENVLGSSLIATLPLRTGDNSNTGRRPESGGPSGDHCHGCG